MGQSTMRFTLVEHWVMARRKLTLTRVTQMGHHTPQSQIPMEGQSEQIVGGTLVDETSVSNPQAHLNYLPRMHSC